MGPSRYHQPHSSTSPCIRLACQDVSQTCSFPSAVHRPSVGQIPLYSAALATSQRTGPPSEPMQAVISHLVPQATIQHVQAVPSVHCQRAYGVKVSDGTSLVLVAPPPPMVKLLRSERASVVSEAAVLKWLENKAVEPLLQERTPEPDEASGKGAIIVGGTRQLGIFVDDAIDGLHPFLPRLIAHTAAPNETGREFNLLRPTLGVPVPELSPPLTSSERKEIDFQAGQLYNKLCQLVSPTGRFGPAFAVLPPATSVPPLDPIRPARRDVNTRMIESKGVQSWMTAFHSMLEAVLRDGEDMQVMLGYGSIRRHFKRLGHTLDEVTSPRLVAVDIGKDINTLVMRRPRRRTNASPASSRRASLENDGSSPRGDLSSDKDKVPEINDTGELVVFGHSDIIMAGMRDWSNFVFGDPLFATSLCRGSSNDFLRGFTGRTPDQSNPSVLYSGMVQDEASAHIRALLYDCYHTVTTIVREFFRPRKDSGGRELEARRRLSTILVQLDALDDVGDHREMRLVGELGAAKRSKSGEED
ncbi:hypothetical protein CMUS01_09347 [Colletotrichum musicola]|uniref:Aminoglycoside phosphotransferase domain-containing protein n=1 Tax=Colletotrichum musicola TaxID=2175873 RepID=A0A8H6K9H1_9PEZI|nr:hypothetical protein CMUS01_09347 [Colletotrichum musicola]